MREAFEAKVVGQLDLQRALLVTLLAGGHILLESVPGLAKTLSAATLASIVHGSFARVQCTPDLQPSDIFGSQIYDAQSGTCVIQLGPVHANFVLLDEINRSSVKTQSAMLEAMQERQTTFGGQSFPLPKPFMVLATQNPIEEEGTYVLPQAQMDRFLLKEVIDYPTPAEEVTVLQRSLSGALAQQAAAQLGLNDVFFLQDLARRVYVDPAVQNHVVRVVNVTREPQRFASKRLPATFNMVPRRVPRWPSSRSARRSRCALYAATSSPRTSG